MQTQLSAPEVLTSKQLSARWRDLPVGSSLSSLQRYRSDPDHPLHFDVVTGPHPKRNRGYSLALIERIERSWRV